MNEAIFRGISGRLHRFSVHRPHAQFASAPAVYCFARPGPGGRGWTPLFLTAGGLVMEIGGMVTHGSVVAREVGAQPYHDVPTRTGTWWGYFHGVPIEHVHIWIRPRRLFCAARTNDDLTIVMAYSAIEDFHEFSGDPEGNFSRELAEHIPSFYELFRAGEREGQLLGTGYQPNYLRQAAGPGWALVGDAGMNHDSINPSGMSKALVTAEMLAEAIHEGLAGSDAELDAAVRRYQARRDARWLPHWNAVVSFFANMEPPRPERIALIGALAASPELAKRFFAFFQGQEVELGFMDPENLANVVGAAAPPQ